MDQGVTIDGQRVLLNGEPVAEALGDFSVRVLALAIATRSTVDWFNAPDGAEFYSNGYFYKLMPGGAMFHCGRVWSASDYDLEELKCFHTYEPRPAQLDHIALPTVRPMPAVKPPRVGINHQTPENVWRAMDAAAVAASVGGDGRHTLTGRIDVNLWPGDLSHLAPKRGEMTTGRFNERFGLVPPENKNHRCSALLAPADLLVKAREYYPNDEGLLRLYAEMRGYSCQQVEEAIDHAKRL